MAEGETGFKPTLYRRVADKATKFGDWAIKHFGVNEIQPRSVEPTAPTTTVDKWGRPAGEFIKPTPPISQRTAAVLAGRRGEDLDNVSDIGLIPDGTPEVRATAKDRHPASQKSPEVYDREKEMDRTLPEGVTILKPKKQR